MLETPRSQIPEPLLTAPRLPLPLAVALGGCLALPLVILSCSTPGKFSQVGSELAPGQSFEHSLSGGQSHSYRIRLEADQYVRVVVEQKGIDLVLELATPSGEVLTEVDSPNGTQGPETVSEVAKVSGDYRLRARSRKASAEPGLYAIRIADLRPATLKDRLRVEGERAFATAKALMARGDHQSLSEANGQFEQAVRVWQQLGDDLQLAKTLYKIGQVQARNGNWLEAREAYRKSRNFFAGLGDGLQQAILENSLGWSEARVGNPQTATRHYRRAENLFRALEDGKGIVATLSNLGPTLVSLGEFQNALDVYREALVICRELGEIRREADVRVNRGSLMLRLDRLDLARADFERALEIYREFGNRYRIAVTLKWLADVAYQDDRAPEALELIEESLEIRRLAGVPRDQAIALQTLGNVHWKLNKPTAALAAYREALELLREEEEPSSTDKAMVMLDLARVHADSGRSERAMDIYGHALEGFRRAGSRQGQAASRMGLARVLRDMECFAEARDQIAIAVDLIEEIRSEPKSHSLRRSYRDFRQGYYELQVDVLMHLAEASSSRAYEVETFEMAERGRARGLLDALTEAGAMAAPRISPELLDRRTALLRQLESLLAAPGPSPENETDSHATIGHLLLELEELEPRRATPDPNRLADTELLGLDELRQNFLDDDTLLLVYALGEKRSFLWAVSRRALSSHVLPQASEIESLVEVAHQALQRASRKEQQVARRLMRRLSEILLAPVADSLGSHRLLIVPDGALHLLPFAALPDPRFPDPPQAPPRLLVEDHEIVSLPSLSVLVALRRRLAQHPQAPGLMAMIADPIFDSEDPRLAPTQPASPVQTSSLAASDLLRSARDLDLGKLERLPHSGEEARAILALAGNAPTLQALGLAADRERVLNGELAQYRILHFATHGLLHPRYSELSGLVLSLVDERGRPRNGFLRAYEIAGLDLPAELVVLSACRTGLGQRMRGEGIVGLSYSFMHAGTPRVVVSLWNVRDRSTAELMKRFYHQLLDRRQAPASALREAQISMLREEKWTLPRYWAGFVFQGDWRAFT